jgi:YfiH family protein
MSAWSIDRALTPPMWRATPFPDVVAAFTTREGGVSTTPYHALNLGRSTADRREAIETNRALVLTALGLDPQRLATAGQVHGTRVAAVTAPGLYRDCDGLVSREHALALAVSGADCMPILAAAPGVVGAAHSGWRGTADGMPREIVAAVGAAAGSAPADVIVLLGPCIRECCYTVGAEVAARFPPGVIDTIAGELRLSIPRAVTRQLLAHGIRPEHIHDTGACTACEPARYFSHRRDHGLTGRQWGVIALVPPP